MNLAHDEVTHGQRLDFRTHAGRPRLLRLHVGQAGQKLLFMGQEFGRSWEWNFRRGLEWHLLDYWRQALNTDAPLCGSSKVRGASTGSLRLSRQSRNCSFRPSVGIVCQYSIDSLRNEKFPPI
jgi:1,4-alpha-glucan branching enzyme